MSKGFVEVVCKSDMREDMNSVCGFYRFGEGIEDA